MMDPYDEVRRAMQNLTDSFMVREQVEGMRRWIEDAVPKPIDGAETRRIVEEVSGSVARQKEAVRPAMESLVEDIRGRADTISRVMREDAVARQRDMEAIAAVTRNLRYRW